MVRGREFPVQRARLVEDLRRTGYLRDPRILEAFLRVPREEFLPDPRRRDAYLDVPLPIGFGQTISAPSMIAIMLEEAAVRTGERVLEVGTGSGYHAALLACLAGPDAVVTIERIPALAEWGRGNLERTGYGAVSVVIGDGSLGHPGRAPYDCIMATAGAPSIPGPWQEQVRPGGRIVAPVGRRLHEQVLLVARKQADGRLEIEEGTACAFVPLVGEKAWPP